MQMQHWFRNNIFFGIISFFFALNIGCSGSVFESLLGGGPKIISIALTPAERTVPSGVPVEYTIVATLSNNTVRALTPAEMAQVTWSNDNPEGLAAVEVTLSQDGSSFSVVAIKEVYNDGNDVTVVIQASYRELTAQATLTLNDAQLVEINVTPGIATIKRLTTQQYTARGTYTDGSVHDITSVVSWSSDVINVASISSSGKATAQNAGVTYIHASLDGINERTPAQLTVTSPALRSIIVTPSKKVYQQA